MRSWIGSGDGPVRKPNEKPKYYVEKAGRAYWSPSPEMRLAGFPTSVALGAPGPKAYALADEWNAKWDAIRKDREVEVRRVFVKDSLADAFDRYRRTGAWQDKAASTRLEWDRSWLDIEPIFGDQHPASVTLEHMDAFYRKLVRERGVGVGWRVIKTWRALWNVCAAMGLVMRGQDPSLGVARKSLPKRAQRWNEGEVVRLVKHAIRKKQPGLACIIAVAWDTQLSPGDVRALTPAQRIVLPGGWGFKTQRGKTGRAAIGTLSRRTRFLVERYMQRIDTVLMPKAPMFRSAVLTPFRSKQDLSQAFRRVREDLFPGDDRTLMDFRRSGAVEALVGAVDPGALGAKMANTIASARDLQLTYQPVDPAAVRMADEARKTGRRRLREEHN